MANVTLFDEDLIDEDRPRRRSGRWLVVGLVVGLLVSPSVAATKGVHLHLSDWATPMVRILLQPRFKDRICVPPV